MIEDDGYLGPNQEDMFADLAVNILNCAKEQIRNIANFSDIPLYKKLGRLNKNITQLDMEIYRSGLDLIIGLEDVDFRAADIKKELRKKCGNVFKNSYKATNLAPVIPYNFARFFEQMDKAIYDG